MSRLISPGRIIALLVGLALMFVVWGMIFVPGGSGSNILLALVLAVVGVYFVVVNLGPYLDCLFFHGGSRERAFVVHRARQTWVDMQTRLRAISTNKRKRARYSEDALQKSENALKHLKDTIDNVQANWSKTDRVNEQIDAIKNATVLSQTSMNNLLGKTPRHHFLSGWDSLLVALVAALALRAFIVEPFQIPSGSMIQTLLVGDHLFVSKLRYGLINPLSREPSYLVRWSQPQPGDVIVFEAPAYVGTNSGETWIKRVIAGPGQTVRVENGVVFVDGKPYQHVTPPKRVKYMDYFGIGSRGRIFGDTGVWKELEAIYTREEISEKVVHDIYLGSHGYNWPEKHFDADGQPMILKLPGLKCNEEACTVNEGHIFVMGDNRGNSSDGRVWGALPIVNVKGKAIFIWMSVDGSRQSIELGKFAIPAFRWDRWFTLIK